MRIYKNKKSLLIIILNAKHVKFCYASKIMSLKKTLKSLGSLNDFILQKKKNIKKLIIKNIEDLKE